jgi:hypothetical protein
MQERRMAVIEKLLESAENVIAGAEHCWLVTLGPRGRATARPMGRVARRPVESDWTLSFLADARSKKVSEIRAASEVRLIFEREKQAFTISARFAFSGPTEVLKRLVRSLAEASESAERREQTLRFAKGNATMTKSALHNVTAAKAAQTSGSVS